MTQRRFLLNELKNLPSDSGIYRLYRIIQNVWILVYIGKALNIRRRVNQHFDKKFDAVTITFTNPSNLNNLEKILLQQRFEHQNSLPEYNKKVG